MKRYDIDIDTMSDGYHASEPTLNEYESLDGDWVRATEALAIEAERDRFKTENEQLKAECEQLTSAHKRLKAEMIASSKDHFSIIDYVERLRAVLKHRGCERDAKGLMAQCQKCPEKQGTRCGISEPHTATVNRIPDGVPGIRDQNSPCEMFKPGVPSEYGCCLGDGHYLCYECEDMIPDENEENDG